MTPLRPDLPAVDSTNFPHDWLVHFSGNIVGGFSVISTRKPLSDEHSKTCRSAATESCRDRGSGWALAERMGTGGSD